MQAEEGVRAVRAARGRSALDVQPGRPVAAQVWPGAVHYPDFFNPATAVYWEAELRAFAALAPWDGAPMRCSALSADSALGGGATYVCAAGALGRCPRAALPAQLAPWDGAPPMDRSALSAGRARGAHAWCSKVSCGSWRLGQGSHGQQQGRCSKVCMALTDVCRGCLPVRGCGVECLPPSGERSADTS